MTLLFLIMSCDFALAKNRVICGSISSLTSAFGPTLSYKILSEMNDIYPFSASLSPLSICCFFGTQYSFMPFRKSYS